MSTSSVSRRDFLKLSGGAAAAFWGMPRFSGGDPEFLRLPTVRLGRTTQSLYYYAQPSYSSQELGFYNTDSVVHIYQERWGETKFSHNPIWYRTDEGWVHSSFVQPVQRRLNDVLADIPRDGLLMEVTVPFTPAYRVKDDRWKQVYRFYYSTTHWVYHGFTGANGTVWYRALDDLSNEFYLVQADHLRPVSAEELTPISPNVRDKRVEVDLSGQKITAFENGRPVYAAWIATGYFEGDTPIGEFRVERKQPSRHMASSLEGNEFDLPGVPWVCYIAWTGVSLHGTYWHNNYGTPQSHGCINMTPEAAKWFYRWTEPFVPVHDNYMEVDGTTVVVY